MIKMVQDSTDLDMLVQYLSKNPSTYTKPRWNMITSLSDYRPRCRIDIHLLLRTIAELVSSSNTAVFTWKKWRSLQQQVLPASDLGFFKMCCCDHRKWWIHQQLWELLVLQKTEKKNFEKHKGFQSDTSMGRWFHADPIQMEVSWNGGTPRYPIWSSILMAFSIVNHPFGATPILGHLQMNFLVINQILVVPWQRPILPLLKHIWLSMWLAWFSWFQQLQTEMDLSENKVLHSIQLITFNKHVPN